MDWVDIFKGIAILCVVYGHIGGAGQYIYQFHMPAFFFISGYLANFRKYSFFSLFIHKAYSLLLPFITIFLSFLGGVALLRRFGWEETFFDPVNPSFATQLKGFIGHFQIYINLLGATWFIFTLFFVFLIHKVLYSWSGHKAGWLYFLYSCLFYGLGVHLFQTKEFLPYSLDLAMVAQGFFALGLIFRERRLFERINPSVGVLSLVLVLYGALALVYFGDVVHSAIFFPARNMVGGWLNTLCAALSGTLLCYVLAKLIEAQPLKFLTSIFIRCGKDSLGILFFHFLMFKAAYAILAFFRIVPWDYLSRFVPEGNDVIVRFGWLIFLVSSAGSVLLWGWLCSFRPLRFLLGQNRSAPEFLSTKLSVLGQKAARRMRLSDTSLAAGSPWHQCLPIILGFGVFCFLNRWTLSPDNFFAFDDHHSWYMAKFRHLTDYLNLIPKTTHNDRPVRDIILHLMFHWSGYNAVLCHIALFILHLLNGVLLYTVLRKLLARFAMDDWRLPLLATMIWGTWPKAMMGAFWLSGINDSFGFTLALLAALAYYATPKGRIAASLRFLSVLVLFYLQLRTKETYIVFPAILLAIDGCKHIFDRGWSIRAFFGYRPTVLLCLLWCMTLGSLYFLLVASSGPGGSYATSFSPVVMLKNLFRYLVIYFDFYSSQFNYVPTSAVKYVLVGVAFFGIFSIHRLCVRKEAVWIILFVLFAGTMSTVLPLKNQTHFLYLYFPSAFLAIILALAVFRSLRNVNRYYLVAVVGLLLWGLSLSPARRQLVAYWEAIGKEEKTALAKLKEMPPLPPGATAVVLGLDHRANLFTYGLASNKSYMLSVAFDEEDLYREFTPDRIDTSKPYIILTDYPELKSSTIEEYMSTVNETAGVAKITGLSPASAFVGEKFGLMPNGLSAISLFGEEFTPDTRIWINGQLAHGTAFGHSKWITCYFPHELLERPGKVTFTVSTASTKVKYAPSTDNPSIWKRLPDVIHSDGFDFEVKQK